VVLMLEFDGATMSWALVGKRQGKTALRLRPQNIKFNLKVWMLVDDVSSW